MTQLRNFNFEKKNSYVKKLSVIFNTNEASKFNLIGSNKRLLYLFNFKYMRERERESCVKITWHRAKHQKKPSHTVYIIIFYKV